MLGKVGHLARALDRFRLTGLVRSGRYGLGSHIPVLAYHRIYNIDDEQEFPFDVELVSASTVEFKWQMRHLREHYHPITFAELLHGMECGGRLPARPVIVTFDDGFEDNYRLAFPILRECAVPATFFLATGYVGKKGTFWFDEVAYLVGKAECGKLRLDSVNLTLMLDATRDSRKQGARLLLRRFKEVSNAQRLAGLEELRHGVVAAKEVAIRPESQTITWEQVREMAANGMEFGSHTVTHPILSRVDRDGVHHELRDSMEAIEQAIGAKVRVLSYPVGGTAGFGPMVQEVAREVGYELAVSYISGTNRLAAIDRFAMRRIHVERYVDRAGFAAMLAAPEVFAR